MKSTASTHELAAVRARSATATALETMKPDIELKHVKGDAYCSDH